MSKASELISADALQLIEHIHRHGSMAGAARELGLVPSAVSYRIRQIEEGLDVLLFDRRSKHARLTPAGLTLLNEGLRLLQALDAVAHRVKRVAQGWEPQLTIASDGLVSHQILLELCANFFHAGPQGSAPPTRLRLQAETLSGAWHALEDGHADLAICGAPEVADTPHLQIRPLGIIAFAFVVSPHHPLAQQAEPLTDAIIHPHRIVAVADSTRRETTQTIGILPGQDVLTVSTLQDKLAAQKAALGCGFLPLGMVKNSLQDGSLISKTTERQPRCAKMYYAWHQHQAPGLALSWWLNQLANPITQQALLNS